MEPAGAAVVVHETVQVHDPDLSVAAGSEPPIGGVALEVTNQIVPRVTSISIRGCCPLDVHDLVVRVTERGVVRAYEERQTSIIEVKSELVPENPTVGAEAVAVAGEDAERVPKAAMAVAKRAARAFRRL